MTEDANDMSRRQFVGGTALAVATAAVTAMPTTQAAAAATTTTASGGRPKQLFGIGGGFLVQPWLPPLFQRYLLGLSPAKAPKVCWLGPASGESPAGFDSFSRQMAELGCEMYHFDIYNPSTLDFTDYLLGMDIIYVGGGSTKNLIALWREWDFGKALHAAWDAGVVMSGESAGLICWFQSGLTDSYPKILNPVKGLGFLAGSANPHYNIRPDRKTRYRQFIADGSIDSPGLALDQDTAVLYRGDQIVEIVSSRKTATAFKLLRTPTGYSETPLPVRYLGSASDG